MSLGFKKQGYDYVLYLSSPNHCHRLVLSLSFHERTLWTDCFATGGLVSVCTLREVFAVLFAVVSGIVVVGDVS